MSYEDLDLNVYKVMSAEEQRTEMRKWLEDALNNHQSTMRSIGGTMPEQEEDIKDAIEAPFEDLGMLINEYDEDCTAYFIIKYRLENNITSTDDSILETDAYGEHTVQMSCFDDTQESRDTLESEREMLCDLKQLSKIFGFEDLVKSFIAWCP